MGGQRLWNGGARQLDPYTAAKHAVHDESINEIIVSTFAPEKSGWLRRDLPERQVGEIALQSDCMLTGYYNRPDVKPPAGVSTGSKP